MLNSHEVFGDSRSGAGEDVRAGAGGEAVELVMINWRGTALFSAWRTAGSVKNGCGVFISERWPSTSVLDR